MPTRRLASDSGDWARAVAVTRLVVLPFRVVPPDPDTDFLAVGLADALTATLSGLDSIVVRSPLAATAFAGSVLDLSAIATTLDVDAVLTTTWWRSSSRPGRCGSWCPPDSRPRRWCRSSWITSRRAYHRRRENSYFKDDVRRGAELASREIGYVDVGSSGGVWGADRGYCLMIGGRRADVEQLGPVFRSLAPGRGEIDPTPGRDALDSTAELGFLHCGPVGSGHFIKMVHNGIEYGLMQAYAEGFDFTSGAGSATRPEGIRYELDLREIAEVWRRGSVVSSWLLDLMVMALVEDPGPRALSTRSSSSTSAKIRSTG